MRSAVYVRKSRKDHGKANYRLDFQRQDLPLHAASKNWQVEIYDDGHASAAKDELCKLSARNRLEQDIRAGKIDVVLVVELSRLSRDESMEDFVAWLALCAKHGVVLATPGRILNPAVPSEWMMLLMEGGFSSVEMKVLKGRMRQGREKAHRSGVWLGGTPFRPYTYDEDLRKIVVDQEDLMLMQKVWSLIETHSAQAVAKQLGLPVITVRRAISDHYLLLYQAKRIHPDTGELINCQWPAVMTAEQADRIRAARKTRTTNDVRRRFAALLTGLKLLKCGYCGLVVKTWRNSKTRKDGSRSDYYGCHQKSGKDACAKSRMIPQRVLDEKVITNVFGTLGCLDQLMRAWQLSQEDFDLSGRLNELQVAEGGLLKKRENLVSAVAAGLLTFDEIKAQKSEIDAELALIQEERVSAPARVPCTPDWGALTLKKEEFDLLDQIDQRRFLRAVLEEITVYHDYALLKYRFPRAEDGSRVSRIHIPPPRRGRKPRENAR
jgi:site-specific DNA recombinase